jgi:hypothetical protein
VAAAKIDAYGKVTQLDTKATPSEVVTEADVQEPAKLSRLLLRLLADVAALRRRFVPSRTDYEDVAVLNTGAVTQLQHNMAGRVRWWVVGWQCPTNAAPVLREDVALSTSSTLALRSYVSGIVTIRVESAG